MNIAEATTELEIAKFIVETGKDSVGTYHILTGFEGTGCCFWCGLELTGKQKRYCKKGSHWRVYYQHFDWTFARDWCLERYDYRCANCGTQYSHWGPGDTYIEAAKGTPEAHHIIPLEGRDRLWTPYNLPWNLICLCHKCHLAVHAVMRGVSIGVNLTKFDRAVTKGQLVLGGIV